MGGDKALVTITTPEVPASGASPRLRVFVIDVSGSMSAPALVQVAGGAREETGKSILDVVCDSTLAAIATLGPHDGAAIVSFSDFATVRMGETRMDEAGKARAKQVLRELRPGGPTHLWDGLEKGMELIRVALEAGSEMAKCASVDLLTDGLPNVDPPNPYGFVPSLKDYFRANAFRPLINCLGFGSNIQQEVLDELAREGGGLFSFIPSPDMVATNFVNAAAAFGSAYTLTPTLRYGVGQGGAHGEGGSLVPGVSLGLLPYGARVSVLVDTPPGAPPLSSFALRPGGAAGGMARAVERNPDEATAGAACLTAWRRRLVDTLRTCKQKGQLGDYAGALALVRGMSEGMRGESREALGEAAGAGLTCLLADVEGQVAIALSRPEYFQQWGSAYLLSLARAHELQLCANFKDPGLQGYATPYFKTLQGTAGATFRAALAAANAETAARTPEGGGGGGGFHHQQQQQQQYSRGSGSAPPPPAAPPRAAAAQALFDPAGGCVHGEGLVLLADGVTRVRMDALRVGARVALVHPPGATGVVTHTVRTRVEPGVEMVALKSGLVATAWHPVEVGGGGASPRGRPWGR